MPSTGKPAGAADGTTAAAWPGCPPRTAAAGTAPAIRHAAATARTTPIRPLDTPGGSLLPSGPRSARPVNARVRRGGVRLRALRAGGAGAGGRGGLGGGGGPGGGGRPLTGRGGRGGAG